MHPSSLTPEENASQILALFEYNCSHILCAPLNTMEGLLTLLEHETNEKQIPVYFDMILRSAANLEILIGELRQTVAGMETAVVVSAINFTELVNNVLADFDLLLRLKSMKTSITIVQDNVFYSDPDRIQIILKHLICNSIMFSDPSKPTRTIAIVVKTGADNCSITVHDNGCGIESSLLQQIFQPFYRGSEMSTGSGLGLFIVFETSKKIFGSVTVKSRVKHGTTFTLNLRSLQP